MRTGTLTRTRIFRADPALDAALEAGAAREGVKVSVFLREALRNALASPPQGTGTQRSMQVAA
ncbi:ribbon-helix-helix protein, CopG family [Methylobacterium sp. J-072]|uniref:ribbon-helix-helix protein, CopG family n=1 Tax=Methylobacterium sp. J-072 TaxID=2836651 RepID=UPI001FBA621F|nr:ribbon-helix-helix protein, CopG family [Methylobacterium sp. J-072]MCJ2092797.1 ribbon-helix-helix protein, CopG family [Methylobacterium sp. J-072]